MLKSNRNLDFELKLFGTKDQVLITTLDGLSKNPVPHHHHPSMGKLDIVHHTIWASLVAVRKQSLQCRRPGFSPWVGKIPWRRICPPTPVFLPGKSHGQRSLAGYSSWGHKRQLQPRARTKAHSEKDLTL